MNVSAETSTFLDEAKKNGESKGTVIDTLIGIGRFFAYSQYDAKSTLNEVYYFRFLKRMRERYVNQNASPDTIAAVDQLLVHQGQVLKDLERGTYKKGDAV